MMETNFELSGLIADPHLYSTIFVCSVDPKSGELVDALYDIAAPYQEAISKSLKSFHTRKYPDNNLMRYFKLTDNPQMEASIKGKIRSAYVDVEAWGELLYARLDLDMTADLTFEELDAFTEQIEVQYRDGWGEAFELLNIPAGEEAVFLRLWHDEISFLTGGHSDRQIEQEREHKMQRQKQSAKSSIKVQLAQKKDSGERPNKKAKGREER